MKASLPFLLFCFLCACSKPGLQFSLSNGEQYEQSQGQWLLINYWAPWCKPCVKEIPELNALADQHEGHVAILGVNYDGTQGEELIQVADKLGIRFPLMVEDPSNRLGIETPKGLPTTLVINPHGVLVAALEGPQTHRSLLKAMGMDLNTIIDKR